MSNSITNSVFRSRLYKLALLGRSPTRLAALPPGYAERGVVPGDAARGAAVIGGRFTVGSRTVELGEIPWTAAGLDEKELAALHRFRWLGDLAAVDTGEARRRAMQLLESWDEAYGRFSPVSWSPDVLAERLANWLYHHDALFADSEPTFRDRLLDSAARQLRHLRRIAGSGVEGLPRVEVLRGLVFAEACLGEDETRLARALSLLGEALDDQILPDGGHVSRSPGRQLSVLEMLIDIRAVLEAAKHEVPEALRNGIDRMAPVVRFFEHGDGSLACFNGGSRVGAARVANILERSEALGRAPQRTPYARFERIEAGRLVILLDGGPPPPPTYQADAHAGVLSLEASVGTQALFVNCGAASDSRDWRQALRTTAAHTTVVVNDTNSSELRPNGFGRRVETVDCDRGEIEGSTWVSSSHDGYEHRFGLTHRRRLYVDSSGDDVRGEDILVGTGEWPFASRFHLHPEVEATQAATEPAIVTLRLPDGERWRMRANMEIGLEDSVYRDESGQMRPTRQIVLRGRTAGEATTVKWAVQRVRGESKDS